MEIYGHRGAKGVVMENSLLGFALAASQGVDRFELDIRLSLDNQLMVIHDENLLRLANSPLIVSESNAQLLSQTHLKGTDQGIPTLEEVVAACPNVLHWQFEIKTQNSNPKFVRPLKRLIDKFNLHDKVVITSKHVGTLKIFQRMLPHISRGYVQEWLIPNGIRTAQKLNCEVLALNRKLASKRRIRKAQSLGLIVSVWTVNLKDDIDKLAANGADSIISDYPQMAREHLYK